jgi:hypothetical protein
MHNHNEKIIEEINIIPERSEGLAMPHTGMIFISSIIFSL